MAAGVAVELRLDVLATHPGGIRESVRLVAEDGVVEAVIAGEVRISGETCWVSNLSPMRIFLPKRLSAR